MKTLEQKKEIATQREKSIIKLIKRKKIAGVADILKELNNSGFDISRNYLTKHILASMTKKGAIHKEIVLIKNVATNTYVVESKKVKKKEIKKVEKKWSWNATCNNFPPVSCLI